MAAESKQENAIIVDHVKKHFKVFLDKGQSFKERLLFRNRRRYCRYCYQLPDFLLCL